MIAAASPGLRIRRGLIAARTGIETRRVAEDHEQCSDLAVAAARRALADAQLGVRDIDLLIFAAAGQDLIEPATSHIVQQKLGTNCAVFDIKNACNSFLNGVQVADAMIVSGRARTALVVTGEICSRAARYDIRDSGEFRRYFPGFTMGDAGAAMVLRRTNQQRGIRFCGFESRSMHWPLATIASGGSMYPRGDDMAYLAGDGPALKDAFVSHGPAMLQRLMERAGVTFDDADRILVHQVGVPYHAEMLRATGIPVGKVECTVAQFGNMASASLPVAHAHGVAKGSIAAGQRILWIGMASGMSVGLVVVDT
ncbi:MAG TPA: 3-oxoacyl-[acyl-carrier-protein] synthase III C-terminal domain-containing protein [Gemmatimonas sp.]|nr:3-oxoacyl-[acyl-carrier-protein] synthase III C-terminal domain-containing protein [Gemmatimonas sp.]